ncbi:cobalt transport protein CbiM [Gottschalkia purinilytica]|uniref:Cobalt transport protein CbiM n=1 Tax=Gottschalkia purinilytica TaxID=1503 RepID=A0A0L0W748_GOTPU|nr:energy-coupling factor ABC transporter permease [Gottschalkia purinilytica]KNF07339.1 cobalt transport protein CbiM [Gottschalkia purinilytica]
MGKRINKILYSLLVLIFIPKFAYAMHIAEGFLPPAWSLSYFLLCLPFTYLGIKDIRKKANITKDMKLFISLAGAYCFILSALKLPSFTGSSSHPTGIGFGAITLGPFVMTIIGLIVLLFQALFLAHGGLTTLGANTFSMAVVGPIVSYLVYKCFKNKKLGIFFASALGNLITYMVTATQLAIAMPSKTGGILGAWTKFMSIFAVTQIPLAIAEGILTVLMFNVIEKYSKTELDALRGEVFYGK